MCIQSAPYARARAERLLLQVFPTRAHGMTMQGGTYKGKLLSLGFMQAVPPTVTSPSTDSLSRGAGRARVPQPGTTSNMHRVRPEAEAESARFENGNARSQPTHG